MATLAPLVVICGPTASGKTDLAIRLAKKYDGEIICADSQTLRRDLDIGTAKPAKKERTEVPHHLIDVIDPYDNYSVADFKHAANRAIDEISSRGKLSFLVGGSGLYIDSVIFDFEFRHQRNKEEGGKDLSSLSVEELKGIIKQKGYKLPENHMNPRHLISTIRARGVVPKNQSLRANTLLIGVHVEKQLLHARIEQRVAKMFAVGLVQEAKDVAKKYGDYPQYFDAIGYKIILQELNKSSIFDEQNAKEKFISADKKLAKRQVTWFKRNKNIQWIHNFTEADRLVAKFVTKFATIDA